MKTNLVAAASVEVQAPIDDVWKALVSPATIQKYMFGATVITTWREGDSIAWRGKWNGKPFEDKGIVLQFQPPHFLKYRPLRPLAGAEDKPQNYHTVTVELKGEGEGTRVSLAQDNNPTDEAPLHSEKNWQTMLGGLKRVVETLA